MTSFKLPILYKKDKLGKLRYWEVWTKDEILYRRDGTTQENKQKEVTVKIVKGNTLRTPSEQAVQEAKKEWLKKIDQSFAVAEDDEKGMKLYESIVFQKENSKADTNVGISFDNDNDDTTTKKRKAEEKIPVMLAKNFYTGTEDREISPFVSKFFLNNKDVGFQPKLDGVRCIASYDATSDTVHLKSRNNKEFMYLEHIRDSLKKYIFKKHPTVILDGEIYYHNPAIDSVTRYQFVSSVAKISRLKPHEEETKVEYWVFDLIRCEERETSSLSFVDRYKFLSQKLFKKKDTIPYVVLTPTSFKQSETTEELERFLITLYNHYTEDLSFEGVMLKAGDSLYKDGRQSSLVKFKLFSDEEWVVVDAKRSEGGNQDGAVVWILRDPEDEEKIIEAKQVGDVETSKQLFINKNKYIGKLINIRFNEKTEAGLPRFPRAISFVEDKN